MDSRLNSQRFSLWSLVAIVVGGTFFGCLSFISPVHAANYTQKECETSNFIQDAQEPPMSISPDANICPIVLFAKQVSSERNGIVANYDITINVKYGVFGMAYDAEHIRRHFGKNSIIQHKPPSLTGTILKRE